MTATATSNAGTPLTAIPTRILSIQSSGNDHHLNGATLQPGLNYEYEEHPPVANQSDEDKLAARRRAEELRLNTLVNSLSESEAHATRLRFEAERRAEEAEEEREANARKAAAATTAAESAQQQLAQMQQQLLEANERARVAEANAAAAAAATKIATEPPAKGKQS